MKSLIIIMFSILLASCGGGGGDTSSGGGSSSLVGTWSGSINQADISFQGPLSISITSDDGANFAGSVSSPSAIAGCQNFSFAGTRSGSNISFGGAVNGTSIIQFSATITSNNISGTWVVSAGSCGPAQGTLSVSRQ